MRNVTFSLWGCIDWAATVTPRSAPKAPSGKRQRQRIVADLLQPFQQRYRGRQQRLDADRALPRERLPLQALRLAAPVAADEEMQPHMRVRIHILDAAPFLRRMNRQAQLLDKLALERIDDGLAALHFPAREFPVAVIRLAGRTLAEQHIAIRLDQDADGDIDRLRLRFSGLSYLSHAAPSGSLPA